MSFKKRLGEILGRSLRKFFEKPHHRYELRFLWLGGFVGLCSGVAAILFREAIDLMAAFLFGEGTPFWEVIRTTPTWKLFVYPTLGGAFVAWFTDKFAPEAKGHGVPEIMNAVATERGVIRPRVTFIKLFASTISIGTGSSVGREGPTALIGSAIGSYIAQLLNFPPNKIKMLVGCGAAAGIAATFNAPLAGTAFAIELIVGHFSVRSITAIVFSAMMATLVSHNYFGNVHLLSFKIPFHLTHPFELLLYCVLGIVMAVFGLLFTKTLYFLEDITDELKIPSYALGALGGLIVAATLIYLPYISGPSTWDILTFPLTAKFDESLILFFLLIAVAKILATSLSLATGASGGIFAPSLTIGGSLGATFGYFVARIFPSYTNTPSGYALVGMGGFVAAVTQAPLTAITMIFELTGNMSIILPLIVCSGISISLFNHFSENSIYTLKLARRGIDLTQGKEKNILQSIQVSDVYVSETKTFNRETSIQEAIKYFESSRRSSIPVVNKNNKIIGVASFWDLKQFLLKKDSDKNNPVTKAMTDNFLFVTAKDSLYEAFLLISSGDFEYLPVLNNRQDKKVVGRIMRQHILEHYKNKLTAKQN